MANKASEAYAREKTARSLDTICVHNITNDDVVFWVDRYGTQAAKTMVPASSKDIGFGKGNAHIPRFKAEMFTEKLITEEINRISDAKWTKDSKVYRTKDEKLAHAESEQIRTNDRALWMKLYPEIWLGVVEKFGNLDLPEANDDRPVDTGSAFGDTVQRTGLADKPYEPTHTQE
jgi:hypothetical protein